MKRPFKPGNRVRCVKETVLGSKGWGTVGQVYTVSRVSDQPDLDQEELIWIDEIHENVAVRADRFELVEGHPFKPGDRIRCIKEIPENDSGVLGEVYTVTIIRSAHDFKAAGLRNAWFSAQRFELFEEEAWSWHTNPAPSTEHNHYHDDPLYGSW
jgi:hypothetical protein